ncbi:MAG: hypothetical protein EBZ69_03075 [Alphaproteobacteria bacterium]|nr:hypothetical protein [Alphaproteobacteria bacterium]NDC55784.1 hypothetical protein [Alphaproteobacteria bacterium]NDG03816.1 hypothetical protein [Alphaproteobacteria bacterium]
MTSLEKKSSAAWRLEKRVPLGVMVTLFLQTLTIVWWASAEVKRQDFQDSQLLLQNNQIATFDDTMMDVQQRLARVEERVSASHQLLLRLDEKLGR